MRKNETKEAFTERPRLVFSHLQTKGFNCRQKPEATSYCVDVDSGAWVEQRSCLRHADAKSLRRYARRSERRSHGLVVWVNWKTESRIGSRGLRR